MRIIRMASLAGAVCLVLGLSGCIVAAAAAGAAGGVAYVKGASVMTLEGGPTTIAAATEQAFFQLGVPVISNRVGSGGGEVLARTSGDDKVSVEIEPRGSELSKVTVRVGVFGDRHFQNQVLSAISDNLRSPPPPPAEAPPQAAPPQAGND